MVKNVSMLEDYKKSYFNFYFTFILCVYTVPSWNFVVLWQDTRALSNMNWMDLLCMEHWVINIYIFLLYILKPQKKIHTCTYTYTQIMIIYLYIFLHVPMLLVCCWQTVVHANKLSFAREDLRPSGNRMDPCCYYLAKIVYELCLRAAKNRAALPDNIRTLHGKANCCSLSLRSLLCRNLSVIGLIWSPAAAAMTILLYSLIHCKLIKINALWLSKVSL